MTTPATDRIAGPFAGNGVNTSFPFTFKIFAKTDILVTFANSAGAESVKVLDSDYSVAVNANQDTSPGGTVTYPISGTALAASESLVITGALPLSQETDLPDGGDFDPGVINDALDRLTMLLQQQAEELSRAVKVDVTSTTDPTALIDTLVAAQVAAAASQVAAGLSASAASASASTAGAAATTAGGHATTASAAAASAAAAAASVLGLQVVSKSADYTLVLADAGNTFLHPSADTTPRTFTVPANASVAFPVNTVISFINQRSAGTLTIAITSDTLVAAVSNSTGSRTLPPGCTATAVKLSATEWFISGAGMT